MNLIIIALIIAKKITLGVEGYWYACETVNYLLLSLILAFLPVSSLK